MPTATVSIRPSIVISLCAVVLACPTAATAAQNYDVSSANYVLPFCKRYLNEEGPGGTFTQGYCAGLVVGMAFIAKEDIGRPWCLAIPKGVTGGQTVRVVVKYIEARPNRMHEKFTNLAFEALVEAWPCK